MEDFYDDDGYSVKLESVDSIAKESFSISLKSGFVFEMSVESFKKFIKVYEKWVKDFHNWNNRYRDNKKATWEFEEIKYSDEISKMNIVLENLEKIKREFLK